MLLTLNRTIGKSEKGKSEMENASPSMVLPQVLSRFNLTLDVRFSDEPLGFPLFF